MFICFIDIDGVFYTEQSYFYWDLQEDGERKSKLAAERFCPISISNLNYLCQQVPELNIVISSTWRTSFSLDDLRILFGEEGFKYIDRIIDITPVQRLRGDGRELEIEAWLKEHPEVKDWVAVDDHAYAIPKDHLVLTLQEDGFNIFHVYSIIERFNPEWKRPVFLM